MSIDRTEIMKCERCGKEIPEYHSRWVQEAPSLHPSIKKREVYCFDCVGFIYIDSRDRVL